MPALQRGAYVVSLDLARATDAYCRVLCPLVGRWTLCTSQCSRPGSSTRGTTAPCRYTISRHCPIVGYMRHLPRLSPTLGDVASTRFMDRLAASLLSKCALAVVLVCRAWTRRRRCRGTAPRWCTCGAAATTSPPLPSRRPGTPLRPRGLRTTDPSQRRLVSPTPLLHSTNGSTLFL